MSSNHFDSFPFKGPRPETAVVLFCDELQNDEVEKEKSTHSEAGRICGQIRKEIREDRRGEPRAPYLSGRRVSGICLGGLEPHIGISGDAPEAARPKH